MQRGKLLDPDILSKHLEQIGAGAWLRGVEVVLDGTLEKQGRKLFLRLAGNDQQFELLPLGTKVQWDLKRKRPEPATDLERHARKRLGAAAPALAQKVRLTGPFQKRKDGGFAVQVRQFDWLP